MRSLWLRSAQGWPRSARVVPHGMGTIRALTGLAVDEPLQHGTYADAVGDGEIGQRFGRDGLLVACLASRDPVGELDSRTVPSGTR